MTYQMEFTKDDESYNTKFKKGEVVNASKAVREALITKGVAKDFKEPKQKVTKKED